MSKLFVLDRSEDNTGNTGIGIIADGCQFPNGKVVVSFRGKFSSTVVWDSLIEMKSVSCTHSKTKVVWLDKNDN